MTVTSQFHYYSDRAQHYSKLALEASNPVLKEALEAVARDFSAHAATADRSREILVIDGVAPEI